MKRIFSILFLSLFLLNSVGYYGLFVGWKISNTKNAQTRFDTDNISENQTITVKIPLTLPYPVNDDFKRVDGEFQHGGEYYRMVKQKHQNDTLYIVCVRDHQSKKIQQALAEYVNSFTDTASNEQSTGNVFPTLIKDYIVISIDLSNQNGGWEKSIVHSYREVFPSYPLLTSISQPPERA